MNWCLKIFLKAKIFFSVSIARNLKNVVVLNQTYFLTDCSKQANTIPYYFLDFYWFPKNYVNSTSITGRGRLNILHFSWRHRLLVEMNAMEGFLQMSTICTCSH